MAQATAAVDVCLQVASEVSAMLSEGTTEALEEVFAGFAATAFNPANIANKQSVVGRTGTQQLAAWQCTAAVKGTRHTAPTSPPQQQQQQMKHPAHSMVGHTQTYSSMACLAGPARGTRGHAWLQLRPMLK
jgi:hypothetical protein